MDSQVFLKNDSGSVNVNVNFGSSGRQKQTILAFTIICSFFVIGILGNFLALVKLARKRNFSNGSYTLMLRCLIANNLIGLMGATIMVIVKRFFPAHLLVEYSHWFCICWVIFRFFGMSSGCIAVIMSIDRFIALKHPAFHQEHFTRKFIRNTIIGLSFIAGIITLCPLFGFGVYIDEETKKCLRYRDAKTFQDRAYAILFFIFGSLICITIVTCNTFVMKVILFKKRRKTIDSSSSLSHSSLAKASTIDIQFSKLMAFLSLIFVICWMPQMISIIIALKSNPLVKEHWFFKLSDTLIALLFTLDPYIYVLSGKNLMQFWCCRPKRRSSSFRSQFSIIDNTVDNSL